MRPSLFWDVTLHGLIVIYRSFATTYRSHLQTWSLLHGTYRLSQKSVNSYQSTPSNTPEERRLRFFYILLPIFFYNFMSTCMQWRPTPLAPVPWLQASRLSWSLPWWWPVQTRSVLSPDVHRKTAFAASLQTIRSSTYTKTHISGYEAEVFQRYESSDWEWLPIWPLTRQTTSYNMMLPGA